MTADRVWLRWGLTACVGLIGISLLGFADLWWREHIIQRNAAGEED